MASGAAAVVAENRSEANRFRCGSLYDTCECLPACNGCISLLFGSAHFHQKKRKKIAAPITGKSSV